MCKNKKVLVILFLTLLVFGLLTTLVPLSDFDHDGILDSLVTEGMILGLMLFSLVEFVPHLPGLPLTCSSAHQRYSFLIVPPPITNG